MPREFNLSLDNGCPDIKYQLSLQGYNFGNFAVNEFDYDLASVHRLFIRKLIGDQDRDILLIKLKSRVLQHVMEVNKLKVVK